MFELLKKEVEKFYSAEIEGLKNKKKEDVILNYGTNLTIVKYKNGELEEEKAYKRALKRAINEKEQYKTQKLHRIEEAEKAEDLQYIIVDIDWIRNRTWGYNPNVKLHTNCGTYCGSASGCGYDKESAAVAETLNASPEVRKALYSLAETMLQEQGETAYKYSGSSTGANWRNSIGYGSGYSILPYFEGGVGVSCFECIFNKMGFIWKNAGSSSNWDCYHINKKEA